MYFLICVPKNTGREILKWLGVNLRNTNAHGTHLSVVWNYVYHVSSYICYDCLDPVDRHKAYCIYRMYSEITRSLEFGTTNICLFVWLGFNVVLKGISLIWRQIVHFTLLLALLRWKTGRKPRKNYPRDCRSHILWLTHIPEGRQTDSILWTVHRSRLRKCTR